MTILTSLLAATNFRNPFLRTLVPSLGLAFGIQAAVAVPSILARSERFYDLSGSATYISCAALSLTLPLLRARSAAAITGAPLPPWSALFNSASPVGLNWRQVALSAAVTIWAARLGSYLFKRITADSGEDSRFEKIRGNPPKFFGAFMIQAIWVSSCLMPVLALNALPASTFAALGSAVTITDIIGFLLYIGGLSFEATADKQKSDWVQEKKEKKHDEDFLTRGLWSKSRHPNYFGESTLWTGIATVSAGVLASGAGVASMGLATGLAGKALAIGLAGLSPAFVTFILLKVSGVPLSEDKYDKKYGDREDYKKWKRETPMFIPKL